MDCIQFNYKGLTLEANPREVSFRQSKKINTTVIPFKKSKTQELCRNPGILSGSGSFTGKNAQQQLTALLLCYRSKGSDYLFSPLLPPTKMYFTALRIHANAETESIDYDFEFTEDPSDKQLTRANRYTFVQDGENLFDVANRIGYPVEYLAEFNGCRDLFSVQTGEKIWLR